jgi:hypothetical protein
MSRERKRAKLRAAVAEATHRAVCELSNSDGLGHCMLYAALGATVATVVLGKKYYPQAGCLYLYSDPDDPDLAFTMDPSLGLMDAELHCWIACAGEGTLAAEIADLSARHYRRMVEGERFLSVPGAEAQPAWKLPDPPGYLWLDLPASGQQTHPWARFVAQREASMRVNNQFMEHVEEYKPVIRRAVLSIREKQVA